MSLSSDPPVLTHGDFAARNIIVHLWTGNLVGVVDWMASGWYPPWVEGIYGALKERRKGPRTAAKVRKALPAYAKEGFEPYASMFLR